MYHYYKCFDANLPQICRRRANTHTKQYMIQAATPNKHYVSKPNSKHKTVSHMYIRSGSALTQKLHRDALLLCIFFLAVAVENVFPFFADLWHVNNDVVCACNLYVLQVTTTTFFSPRYFTNEWHIFSLLLRIIFHLVFLQSWSFCWSYQSNFYVFRKPQNRIMRSKIEIKNLAMSEILAKQLSNCDAAAAAATAAWLLGTKFYSEE